MLNNSFNKTKLARITSKYLLIILAGSSVTSNYITEKIVEALDNVKISDSNIIKAENREKIKAILAII